MSSTYSTNLAIELMGTGDQAGTWGTTTNTNLGTLIEQAISGYVTQAVATGTDTTITIPNGASGTARNMFIELTGTGGASTNLIVPNNKKLYFVYNNTSSGQVTVKVSGQTGVSVANGTKVILVSNGTDIVNATSYGTGNVASFSAGTTGFTPSTATTGAVTLAGTLATTNGGTGLTSFTANGVLYASSSSALATGTALQFDGTNLGVGAAPSYAVDIRNAASTALRVGSNSNAFGSLLSWDNSSGTGRLWTLGAYDFVFGVNSTEQMRLTSTGLGIGTSSPASKLDVSGTVRSTTQTAPASGAGVEMFYDSVGGVGYLLSYNRSTAAYRQMNINASLFNFGISGSTAATIDSSGNLGLGVTPSAWSTFDKNLQVGAAAVSNYSNLDNTFFASNTYYGTSNFRYITTGQTATMYRMLAGVHSWLTAPSGTAGNAISFTQAMTLDASGNLGLGTTSPANSAGYSTFSVSGSTGGQIAFMTGGVGKQYIYSSSTDLNFYNSQTGNLIFYTTGSERARIDSSGNLLVGTTSTSSLAASGRGLIEVNGSSDSAFALKAAGTLYGYLYTSSSEFRVANTTANPVTFFTNNTERARIDSSGNLLVGTTTSGNKLYVAGGASTPVVAVTFSATAMTVNCQLSNTFSTTFTANVTTAPTISNPSDGQTINWFITQDATGSRTMTWPASFKWAGGTAGVLSTAANSVDLVVATYRSATGFWYVSLSKAFS